MLYYYYSHEEIHQSIGLREILEMPEMFKPIQRFTTPISSSNTKTRNYLIVQVQRT